MVTAGPVPLPYPDNANGHSHPPQTRPLQAVAAQASGPVVSLSVLPSGGFDPGDPGEPPEPDSPGPRTLRLTLPTQPADANGSPPNTNGQPAAHAAPFPPPPPADHGMVLSPASAAVRARAFPAATDGEWNDWKWQLRNRVRDLAGLDRVMTLSPDERDAVARLGDGLPVGITPYYAALMNALDPTSPLRRTMVPVTDEFTMTPGEAEDPLAEDADMPVPGLVHRYPDRVLFLVTSFCAVYCRYCTRSRLVGKTGEYHFNQKQFEKALAYLEATPEVRDVLISGGDPLTMADDRLDWLLSRLRAIPHIEFIRIGTKVPAVLPQRITPKLCETLRRYHPLWMSIHFTHPDEVTPEVAQACGRLADAGIPLGSQTVLLRGVNDNVETMKSLMHKLLKIRVRPYYIYQCDPIPGSAHFRTPIETGLKIIEGLRGHTTGYAVPQYVIDAPGGGGKLPIMPEYMIGRDGDEVILRNYAGETFRYPDPLPRDADRPQPAISL